MELVIIQNKNKQHRVTFAIDETRLKIAMGTSVEDIGTLVKHTRILQEKLKITKTLRGDPRVIEGHFMVSLLIKRRSGQIAMANYSSITGLTTRDSSGKTTRNWWSRAVSLLKRIN